MEVEFQEVVVNWSRRELENPRKGSVAVLNSGTRGISGVSGVPFTMILF